MKESKLSDLKFFRVVAKCGHVGKGKFYEGEFFVRAVDGRDASARVRAIPRVKHHHKDAILSVTRIGYEEFKAGQANSRLNPYFSCTSKQEQLRFIATIAQSIREEFFVGAEGDCGDFDRRSKLDCLRRCFRKMDKYGYANAVV